MSNLSQLAPEAAALPDGLPPALDTETAAIYTGLAPKTLEKLRHNGSGPKFVRYSRNAVRYRVSDLDEWMSARTVSSTSQKIAA